MKHIFFTLFCICFYWSLMAQNFSSTPNEEHCFLLLPSKITNMSELGAAIAKHNHTYYPKLNLEVSTVAMKLEQKTVFYYIPGFKNKAEALHYYHSLLRHKSSVIVEDNAQDYFIISKKNLNEVLKAKTLSHYKKFFKQDYL